MSDTGEAQPRRDTALPKRRDAAPADIDLARVWTGVAAVVWRRDTGWLERLAGRLLRSPGLARALLTTPSLLVPWLIASAVVLGAGAAATVSTGRPLVALLAPAVAAAGIAYAYGPGIDPAWELSCSMAVSDRMVLLVRALGVLAVDAVLGLAASAASGAAVGITFGWLVPMTAISALALAAATLARSANVGVAAGLAGVRRHTGRAAAGGSRGRQGLGEVTAARLGALCKIGGLVVGLGLRYFVRDQQHVELRRIGAAAVACGRESQPEDYDRMQQCRQEQHGGQPLGDRRAALTQRRSARDWLELSCGRHAEQYSGRSSAVSATGSTAGAR